MTRRKVKWKDRNKDKDKDKALGHKISILQKRMSFGMGSKYIVIQN